MAVAGEGRRNFTSIPFGSHCWASAPDPNRWTRGRGRKDSPSCPKRPTRPRTADPALPRPLTVAFLPGAVRDCPGPPSTTAVLVVVQSSSRTVAGLGVALTRASTARSLSTGQHARNGSLGGVFDHVAIAVSDLAAS